MNDLNERIRQRKADEDARRRNAKSDTISDEAICRAALAKALEYVKPFSLTQRGELMNGRIAFIKNRKGLLIFSLRAHPRKVERDALYSFTFDDEAGYNPQFPPFNKQIEFAGKVHKFEELTVVLDEIIVQYGEPTDQSSRVFTAKLTSIIFISLFILYLIST